MTDKSIEDLAAEFMAENSAPTNGSASDTKPGNGRTDKSDAEPPRKLSPKMRVLHAGIVEVYTAGQMAALMFDPFVSEAIGQTKIQIADAWIDLAQKDPKVLKLLEKLTTGSAWGGVVMAHAPLIIPILAKYGIVPGGALFGGKIMNATNGIPNPPQDTTLFDDAVMNGHVTANGNGNGE